MTFQRKDLTFEEEIIRLRKETETIRQTMRAAARQVVDPPEPNFVCRKPTIEDQAEKVTKILGHLEGHIEGTRSLLTKLLLLRKLDIHAADAACPPAEALIFAQKAWDIRYQHSYGVAHGAPPRPTAPLEVSA